jgi:hypothetical protein
MSTTSSSSSDRPLRALVLREGRPATVESVSSETDEIAKIVGGEPMVLPLNAQYALVFAREGASRPNVRVIDAGSIGAGVGTISGTCVIFGRCLAQLTSLEEGDITPLRGWLEARRVGVC